MGVNPELDAGLGADPSSRVTTGRSRRPSTHRRARVLGIIFLGGTVGTFLRATLEDAAPAAPHGVPWTTLTINVVGALLLGVLLESLARIGPDTGWHRSARLGLGTGVLGGFTTYSTFALETVQRLTAGAYLIGVGYAVASVVLGIGAAAIGYRLAHRIGYRRAHRVGHGAAHRVGRRQPAPEEGP